MSEHRLEPAGKRWVLARLPKHCPRDCACVRKLAFYAERFLSGADEEWSIAEVATVETLIFATLCCVRDNSPDPAMRRYATIQLLAPFWDRQRRGEELTDAEW
jgi:hypothetical protein